VPALRPPVGALDPHRHNARLAGPDDAPASSRSRHVRTVRSDSPVYRTSVATDGNAAVSSGPAWVARPASTKLARGGRLPAAVGRDRGQVEPPRDRLDAHRTPPGCRREYQAARAGRGSFVAHSPQSGAVHQRSPSTYLGTSRTVPAAGERR